jgi:hypothetical protein
MMCFVFLCVLSIRGFLLLGMVHRTDRQFKRTCRSIPRLHAQKHENKKTDTHTSKMISKTKNIGQQVSNKNFL